MDGLTSRFEEGFSVPDNIHKLYLTGTPLVSFKNIKVNFYLS